MREGNLIRKFQIWDNCFSRSLKTWQARAHPLRLWVHIGWKWTCLKCDQQMETDLVDCIFTRHSIVELLDDYNSLLRNGKVVWCYCKNILCFFVVILSIETAGAAEQRNGWIQQCEFTTRQWSWERNERKPRERAERENGQKGESFLFVQSCENH